VTIQLDRSTAMAAASVPRSFGLRSILCRHARTPRRSLSSASTAAPSTADITPTTPAAATPSLAARSLRDSSLLSQIVWEHQGFKDSEAVSAPASIQQLHHQHRQSILRALARLEKLASAAPRSRGAISTSRSRALLHLMCSWHNELPIAIESPVGVRLSNRSSVAQLQATHRALGASIAAAEDEAARNPDPPSRSSSSSASMGGTASTTMANTTTNRSSEPSVDGLETAEVAEFIRASMAKGRWRTALQVWQAAYRSNKVIDTGLSMAVLQRVLDTPLSADLYHAAGSLLEHLLSNSVTVPPEMVDRYLQLSTPGDAERIMAIAHAGGHLAAHNLAAARLATNSAKWRPGIQVHRSNYKIATATSNSTTATTTTTTATTPKPGAQSSGPPSSGSTSTVPLAPPAPTASAKQLIESLRAPAGAVGSAIPTASTASSLPRLFSIPQLQVPKSGLGATLRLKLQGAGSRTRGTTAAAIGKPTSAAAPSASNASAPTTAAPAHSSPRRSTPSPHRTPS